MQGQENMKKVVISCGDEEPLQLEYGCGMTVKELKYALTQQFDIPEQKQMLTLFDQTTKTVQYLLDFNKTLSQLSPSPTLNLTLQPIQSRVLTFNSLENKTKNKVRKSTNPRSIRRIKPGLILHSKCLNKECEAYERAMLVNFGFGSFNVAEIACKCKCPLCGVRGSNAHNLSYYKCYLHISGEKDTEEQVKLQLQLMSNDGRSHSFKSQGKEDLAVWHYLQANVIELQ